MATCCLAKRAKQNRETSRCRFDSICRCKRQMDSFENSVVKNLVLFSLVGLLLRFLLYGIPRVDIMWLYIVLSFLVGVGGVFLSLAKEYKLSKYYAVGCIFVFLGLLPYHLLL